MTGLWLSAFILWSFSFLAILHAARLAGGGPRFTAGGIRLWRLGRLIPWTSIKAICLEKQDLFGRIFLLPGAAFRLTIYEERSEHAPHLVPHHLPSFHFAADEFNKMVTFLSVRCFACLPYGGDGCLMDPERAPAVTAMNKRARLVRAGLSVVVAVGVVSFVGRKATLNYDFNEGNHYFRLEQYARAAANYRSAAGVDPTFAPAWDRLARCELRSGNLVDAKGHFHKALAMKPDFVEAKVGLARILVDEKDFSGAERLLRQSIRLSPSNITPYLNLSDLELQTGRYREAADHAGVVLKQDPHNALAQALAAKALSRQEHGNE
jgi:hypothetical protein